MLGGRIDILVNNAGIFPAPPRSTTDEATFDRVYAVNVKAPFFLTQASRRRWSSAAAAPSSTSAPGSPGSGIPVGALYSSTKGAMETLTRAWAAEFGPPGIRVNAISPGVILPPDWDRTPSTRAR